MRKKDKTTIMWAIAILVIILFASKTDMFGRSSDQYIEYRCEDISEWTLEPTNHDYSADAMGTSYNGWELILIDHGCPIVQKYQTISTSKISTYDIESSGGNRVCKTNNGYYLDQGFGNDVCQDYFGNNYLFCGCEEMWCGSNQYCYIKCCLRDYVTKGGYTPVVNTCQFETNDILAAETFQPRDITINSLRYPAKGFCMAHPALWLNEDSMQSTTSTTVYEMLDAGETVTIGPSETLTLFYITENPGTLPTNCSSSDELAVDVDTGYCVSTLQFAYFCSEGIWDASIHACVVQASDFTCDLGVYDEQAQVCIYHAPIQADCGDSTCTYSVQREVCTCYAMEDYYCAEGFTLYQPTQEECGELGGAWETCPQCPTGQVCDPGICEPRCNGGQLCTYDSPLEITCNNADAEINEYGECVLYGSEITVCPEGYDLIEGACYIPGTEVIVCPEGYDQVDDTCRVEGDLVRICPDNTWDYNNETGFCEKEAQAVLQCANGDSPTLNAVTGNYECIVEPESVFTCPDDAPIYDQNLDKCMPEILVYDPETDQIYEYKEIMVGCTNNTICEAIEPGLECDVERGICKTEGSFLTQITNNNNLFVYILIGIILLLLASNIRAKRR